MTFPERIFPIAIDNTMRKELVKCETAAKYRFEMGLRSKDARKVDLIAGGAFAKGIEVARRAFYLESASEQAALEKGLKALYEAYGDYPCPASSNKSADRMAGALAFYLERRPLAQEDIVPLFLGGKLAVELSFSFPISVLHPVTGQELVYAGNFDMLGRSKTDGRIWIEDEKTTSQLGDKWANQWQLDSQMTGYCWGAKKLLDMYGIEGEIAGAIINGVAIKKYDYDLARVQVYREEWEVARWHKQMMRDIWDWKQAHQLDDHRQNLDHSCAYYNNPCDFALLCKSRNPERIVEGSFVVERWNPLERS